MLLTMLTVFNGSPIQASSVVLMTIAIGAGGFVLVACILGVVAKLGLVTILATH